MCVKNQTAKTVVLDFHGEPPLERGGDVEFRLLYCGELLGASNKNTRAKHKHALRRQFHPQLKRLWESKDNLGKIAWLEAFDEETPENAQRNNHASQTERLIAKGKNLLADRWVRNGYRFIPLVTGRLALRCSLEILLLRHEGRLINSGDIDNRVKTIFDSLRLPVNLEECGGDGPQDGEDPFYCLLEDDRLISDVSITTDQLLMLPGETEIGPNHAFTVVHVKLAPALFSIEGLRFI